MRVSSFKIFAIKLALFSVSLAYLAGDLFLWKGAAWRTLYARELAAQGPPPAALVYGQPISQQQWARFVSEQNWLRGRSSCTEAERVSMLMDMVRGAILRMRARYNDKNLPDVAAEAEQEARRLASRARSEDEFQGWLSAMGLTRKEFVLQLESLMKSAALLERAVSPLCEVTDEDVARHYALLEDEELMAPAHRALRHIFFSNLGEDEAQVKQRAQKVLAKLSDGEDFAELARRYSEDAHSAPRGGELGEVADDAHFLLPELPIFGEQAIPAGQPTLAKSRWGWHILLAGECAPAHKLTLDEVKESLRTAIQSAQYELATRTWLQTATREAFHKKHLHIHAH